MHLKRNYLFGTTVIAGLLAASAPAFAQSTTPTSTQSNQEATTVGEVVVTGSRLRRSEYNTSNPVQILTSEQTDLRGVPASPMPHAAR